MTPKATLRELAACASKQRTKRRCVDCASYVILQLLAASGEDEVGKRGTERKNGTTVVRASQVYFIFEYVSLSLKYRNELSGGYVDNVNTRR